MENESLAVMTELDVTEMPLPLGGVSVQVITAVAVSLVTAITGNVTSDPIV